MSKIVLGPHNRGLQNDVTAFNIDNDSFATLLNAYQWRGRVKRKRGTSLLGRLQRYIGTTDVTGALVVTILPIPIPIGLSSFIVGTQVFYDPGGVSPVNLITNGPGTAILNRATGVLTIVGSIATTGVIYFPTLPAMGFDDFISNESQYPGSIAFDTRYAYNVSTVAPYDIYDVSFYKNPLSGTYTNYVQKSTPTPVHWNGQDYQQFWTSNYEGVMWTTNGINVPFSTTNIGMQFNDIVAVTVLTPTTANLQITTHGLVVGDFLFINEVVTTTGINFQTGYVTTVTDANNVIVTFPNATLATNGTGGIAQYLTNTSDSTKDCLRWYDGDPTNGSPPYGTITGRKGWVNFCPPLSQFNYSISDEVPRQYYLVGARMIMPYKDRLLFLGPVIQGSGTSAIYLKDTVIYSQNGTPFYTASFTGDPANTSVPFFPILTWDPTFQTATPTAYWEDQTGYGGFARAGVDQDLVTASSNRDALIIGFTTLQTRFIYTQNDILPFEFYAINSELGSGSTFSAVNLDAGVLTVGSRGFLMTNESSSSRFDLQIPDEVFQIRSIDNGVERVCSQRDFINEWAYFTYPFGGINYRFPTQTLLYNYRDASWSVFRETYTCYGLFRKRTGYTWATIGRQFPTWSNWNEPWNSGQSTLLKPQVIAGNQQGFLMVRDEGTNEATSLSIQNINNSLVTCPDHCLNNGDFITITDTLGTVSAELNGKIFSVSNPSQNTFTLNPTITPGLTYLGAGLIKRMYRPFIQTKEFPTAWGIGRKTRLGPQQYLFTTTDDGEVQVLIYLSMNGDSPYNEGTINPDVNNHNNALVYSSAVFTSPESVNLGLTPANTNLQMISNINASNTNASSPQQQIWHRMNTSLIGDTVQIGITLSDEQMRALDEFGDPVVITGVSQTYPAIINAVNTYSIGQLVRISNVAGMTQLNGNNYIITAISSTQITIDVNATGFTSYVSGGSAIRVAPLNQFDEIELHGIIMDVNPSSMLA